jgi:DNA helicase HerA-like ATPase
MAVGRYVTVEGDKRRFFAMITDVSLESADPLLSVNPPNLSDPFIAQVMRGTSLYGTLHLVPMLTLSNVVAGEEEGPQPVKTIPSHYAVVRPASERDVELVFGREEGSFFSIGTPLDMETKVCLDLRRLAERSSGVFGKSGTGKTFLTRLLLIGLLQRTDVVSLVFDMHNEYGWEGSGGPRKVKALKQLFPTKVAVFALDAASAQRRQVSTDHVVEIGYDEVRPEDIETLRETLGLTELAVQASYRLYRHLGSNWMQQFLDLDTEELGDLTQQVQESEQTIQALKRRLESLRRFPFLTSHAHDNSVERMLEYLDRGISVVLEFGRYRDPRAYVLVANLLSRRIHHRYVERMERAMGEDARPPHPLTIVIEEAHRFLSPAMASQTIFGEIAREMRKYNVTLMVIDQRPSAIDEEVMSQIGTKVTCLLDNERDIDAVLTGVSGRQELRAVLARLETQQQAIVLGHAVPMPVVIKVREYGAPQSYRDFGYRDEAELQAEAVRDAEELWR